MNQTMLQPEEIWLTQAQIDSTGNPKLSRLRCEKEEKKVTVLRKFSLQGGMRKIQGTEIEVWTIKCIVPNLEEKIRNLSFALDNF